MTSPGPSCLPPKFQAAPVAKRTIWMPGRRGSLWVRVGREEKAILGGCHPKVVLCHRADSKWECTCACWSRAGGRNVQPVSGGPGQPCPSSKSSHGSGTGMCEVPKCVPEMHSESGVKLQGAGPGGNVCVCLVPPGKGPDVHTLRAACRSRGSSQYDCASSGTPLARNGCLKVHVQSYHHQPTGRECSLHLQLAHLQSVLLLRQLWCPHQLQQSHLVWATGRAS